MALFQKIDKILATEIISLTVVITAAVSSIMIMAKIPKYAEFLFSTPDVLTSFLMLLLYSLPTILKLTLPISLLLSCAIVVMRMSVDRELEAWMSCGVSVLRFARMPTLLGIGVMFISLATALFFEPYSTKQFDKFKWLQTRTLVETFVQMNLKEKSFIYDIPVADGAQFSMYFDKVNSKKTEMENAFIAFSEPGQPYFSHIVAKSAQLSKELVSGYPDYLFKLHDGFIYSYQAGKESLNTLLNQPTASSHYTFSHKLFNKNDLAKYPPPPDWTVTKFSDLSLSLVSVFKDKFKLETSPQNHLEELYPQEYLAVVEKEKLASPNWRQDESVIDKMLFFIKQISIPLTTLFLPAIGVCLGILDPRKKQISVYFGIGLVIFSLYSTISLCQQLAKKFIISPYGMLFITPAVLIIIMAFLLRWRVAYPPSAGFFEFLKSDFGKLKVFFIRRK